MSNRVRSSGVKTASALIATGKNAVSSVVAGADGTNAATVNVYDGTSTSGVKILTIVVKAGDRYVQFVPAKSISVDDGIYLEVSGTGASGTVLFGA